MRSMLRLMAGALRAQGLLQTSGTPFSYVSLAVAGSPRDQSVCRAADPDRLGRNQDTGGRGAFN